MASDITREWLEDIFYRPIAQRTADHHEFLYRNVLVLEGRAAGHSAEMVLLLLLRARVVADMETDTFCLLTLGRRDERTGHDVLEAALAVTDEALAIADALHDDALRGRVHLLRGQLYRRLDDFIASADDYRTSAALLEAALQGLDAVDAALARDLLDATIKLVSVQYVLGTFASAERSLAERTQIAQRLGIEEGSALFDVDMVHWLQALISRASGDLVGALSNVLKAADAYQSKEPSFSKVRILWIAAETLIDFAEAAKPDAPTRAVYLEQARLYLNLADDAAKTAKDAAGGLMVIIGEARARQVERPTSKVPANQVCAVLRRIHETRAWDWALAVDSWITLGRVLSIRGEPAQARVAFAQAVAIADEHHSPGMSWFAKGAL